MSREKGNGKGKDPHSLIKDLPIGMSIINKDVVKTMLSPSTYEWRKIGDLKPGDKVRWWTEDAEVIGVRIEGSAAYLKVIDPLDGQVKEFEYSAKDEFKVPKPVTDQS